MDYVIKSVEGSQIIYLVPAMMNCSIDARDTELDFRHMTTYMYTAANTVDKYFNVSATISNHMPDMVYTCSAY